MTLRARFDRRLAALAPPPGAALVAVSGGPDSLALLDLLAGSGEAGHLSLQVAHVDHGIHPDSGAVATQVRAVAARYRLPVHVGELALGPGTSETAARTARYRWLEGLAAEQGAETIFTAHHQDDQVETILMRFLRGSGPAGLAGIPARRGRLLRPLLPFRREELAEHLHQIGLTAWQDPANRDPRHDRSWLRTTVLPLLRSRMPDVDRRLHLVGRQGAVHRAVVEALLERDSALDLRVEDGGVSVAATPLTGYDSGVLRALLGALGRRAGCLVGPTRAARIERLLTRDRSGAVAELGSGFLAELTFGRLRLFRGLVHPLGWEHVLIQGAAGQARAGEWTLEWTRDRAPDRLERNSEAGWFVDGAYLARPWQPGDRIRPLGGLGRRLVVRCMQDARIARTRRAGWPVIEEGGVVVWIPGVCRSADRIPEPGANALRINAQLG